MVKGPKGELYVEIWYVKIDIPQRDCLVLFIVHI